MEEAREKGRKYQVSAHVEVAFQYAYPRLDSAVTKGLNHLLKAPFCVHPKTWKICIPIDPANCDSFDPLNVPTVYDIIEDLNAKSRGEECGKEEREREKEKEEGEGYRGTRLEGHVRFFRKSFLEPLFRETRLANRKVSVKDEMDF